MCTPGGSKQGTAHSLALLAPSSSGQSPTVPEVSTRAAAAQEGLSPWSSDSRHLAPLHLPTPQAGRPGTESLSLELSRAPAALNRASHTPHSTCCRGVPSCIAAWNVDRTPGPQRRLENGKRSPAVGPEVSAEGWRCASQRAGVRATSWRDDPNPHGLARCAGLPRGGTRPPTAFRQGFGAGSLL